jgi:acetyl-CoA carboxylase carboxyl transferase subunit beta
MDTPDWVLCTGCQRPVYGKRFTRSLRVCPECGHHAPLTAEERLGLLADAGSVEPLRFSVTSTDPLGFVDTVPYRDRLAAAQARTGMREAVLCARAMIEGHRVVAAVMDFRFLGGSLGSAVGELITLAAEIALEERTPLLIVTASGGARMQEGALSLMQMAKTSGALGELDRAGILTISLITDPTFGGVAASFATLTDVVIAEPGARLGFAGRRVIEQTIRQSLPDEFQTAEFLLARGFVDMVVPRSRQRQELGRLLRVAAPPSIPEPAPAPGVVTEPDLLPEPDAWAHVMQARSLDRLKCVDYLRLAFTDFVELHGDRVSGDCPATVGGPAWLGTQPVMVIGQQKGHDPAELMRHNFGMPGPAGYRKAGRLMRLAEKLRLPVVTLVDTPGAYPGADAEENGQAVAIAENLRLMMSLTVPVVSVVIGEGGSGGALGIAVANRVLMFGSSVYSVIGPEGCAAIVWKDAAQAPRAAAALCLTARDLLRHGVVDGVLPEPAGGTGSEPVVAATALRDAVRAGLAELGRLPGPELRAHRHARFRRFGAPVALAAELTAA